MDEGVIEGCEDAGDTEDELAYPSQHSAMPIATEVRERSLTFSDLWSERDILRRCLNLSFLGRHFRYRTVLSLGLGGTLVLQGFTSCKVAVTSEIRVWALSSCQEMHGPLNTMSLSKGKVDLEDP